MNATSEVVKHQPFDQVRWRSIFPWLLLVGGLRLAFRVRVLLLAIAALYMVLVFVSLAERLVTWMPEELSASSLWYPPEPTPDARTLANFFADAANGLLVPWRHFVGAIALVLSGSWSFGHSLVILALVLLQIAIWAALGGAICRIAALGFTRSETPDLGNALRFAKRNYPAFISAPVLTFIGVVLAGLPLAFLGLLMRMEWLAFVAALFWVIVLLMGLGIALLAIGLALGFPLMWAAIAVEETDAFDAISRAFAFLFQRPLRLLWYVLVAAFLGCLGGIAIELLLTATRAMAEGSIAWGIDPESLSPTTLRVIHFWTAGLGVVRTAFNYSYFWCAAVGIYLLLRSDIDSVQLDEVAIEAMELHTPSTLAAHGILAEAQPASS